MAPKTYPERQKELKEAQAKRLGIRPIPLAVMSPPKTSRIRVLPSGIAIIDGDTHISRWVERHGRLDIERQELDTLRQYIPDGGTVVDVGAFIGDHTVAYADFVGPTGRVLAFEPNAIAYEALRHNTKELYQVTRFNLALGSDLQFVNVNQQENAGASWLQQIVPDSDMVVTVALDKVLSVIDLDLNAISPKDSSPVLGKVSFLKIDAEGFEPKILIGARKLIARDRPVLYFEVNQGALARQGFSFQWIREFLESNKYGFTSTDKSITFKDYETAPQYNLLCLP